MTDTTSLVEFMIGPDQRTFAKAICFFSAGGKHCPPKEIKEFWESLTVEERGYYRFEIATAPIVLS